MKKNKNRGRLPAIYKKKKIEADICCYESWLGNVDFRLTACWKTKLPDGIKNEYHSFILYEKHFYGKWCNLDIAEKELTNNYYKFKELNPDIKITPLKNLMNYLRKFEAYGLTYRNKDIDKITQQGKNKFLG